MQTAVQLHRCAGASVFSSGAAGFNHPLLIASSSSDISRPSAAVYPSKMFRDKRMYKEVVPQPAHAHCMELWFFLFSGFGCGCRSRYMYTHVLQTVFTVTRTV